MGEVPNFLKLDNFKGEYGTSKTLKTTLRILWPLYRACFLTEPPIKIWKFFFCGNPPVIEVLKNSLNEFYESHRTMINLSKNYIVPIFFCFVNLCEAYTLKRFINLKTLNRKIKTPKAIQQHSTQHKLESENEIYFSVEFFRFSKFLYKINESDLVINSCLKHDK